MKEKIRSSAGFWSEDEGCDSRKWSGECRNDKATDPGEKYLCVTCEKIDNLNHEVHPSSLPYVSGDYESLY